MIRYSKDGTVRAKLTDHEQRAVWTDEPAAVKQKKTKECTECKSRATRENR